jgi:hypothetical protein
MIDYDTACEKATTAQGLDPACEALRAAGIGYDVQQTGGFCMVLTVARKAQLMLAITQSDSIDCGYMVTLYTVDEWENGAEQNQILAWSATVDGVVAYARALNSGALRVNPKS